jgi:heterodisulfide reductase subunit A
MSPEPTNGDLRVGVFVCDCGLNIAGTVDCGAVTAYAETLPDVVCAVRNKYTCADPGQNEIKNAIHQHRLNRVVVASCTPRMHEPTFRQCVLEAGLNPYLMEMANLREHCSWVHPCDREGATAKAMDLVASAVAKARLLEPQEEMRVPVTKRALVIGGGVAGIEAALELAEAGLNPYLMEMANLREHCSWVHPGDWDGATAKAKDLVASAVARARFLQEQEELAVPVTKRALVIGGGVAGIEAALELADQGHDVTLVEKQASIGGIMAQLDKTYPTMDCSI